MKSKYGSNHQHFIHIARAIDGPASIVRAISFRPCFPARYGQGRTRKRTPGQGSTKGKGKGKAKSDWSMAMSAISDLASVARAVVEGQKGK